MSKRAHPDDGQTNIPTAIDIAILGLLKRAEKELMKQEPVILEDIRALRELQGKVATGDADARSKAFELAHLTWLLDFWRRLAADVLNNAVAGGVPKTREARNELAVKIRRGAFGGYEHFIRSTVRFIYPVRSERVDGHMRQGRRVRGYSRRFGDPEKWVIPSALLSNNARIIYPHVLKAPLPKESNWHRRRA